MSDNFNWNSRRPSQGLSGGFQPGQIRSLELDLVMTTLEKLRVSNSPERFHNLMTANEGWLYSVLARYGYRGSWVKSEGTLKDFDQAYQNWQQADWWNDRIEPYNPQGQPYQVRPNPWVDVYRTAAADPIAGLWISAWLVVGETLGRAFHFSIDPHRLAEGAQVFSTVIQMAAAAKKGSANPYIPPRAGAAIGPPRTHEVPGPYPIAAGEVKPVTPSSAAEGRRKVLGEFSTVLPDYAIVGLYTYDQFGNVYLEQYLAGGDQPLVWEQHLAKIPPAYLPKAPFGTAKYGNAMEALIRDVAGEKQNQYFLDKHPSTRGADLVPGKERLQFNLLQPRTDKQKASANENAARQAMLDAVWARINAAQQATNNAARQATNNAVWAANNAARQATNNAVWAANNAARPQFYQPPAVPPPPQFYQPPAVPPPQFYQPLAVPPPPQFIQPPAVPPPPPQFYQPPAVPPPPQFIQPPPPPPPFQQWNWPPPTNPWH